MRIGELLIMNGVITEEQLGQALKVQENTAKKIGEILIDLGLINERQLVEVLEFQLGIPVAILANIDIEQEAVRLIDESIARKYSLIPFERKHNKLKIAMVDPLNERAVQIIQIQTGMVVQPFLGTRTEIEEEIVRQYGLVDTDQVLARILSSAIEQKASGIHFDSQEQGLLIKYRIGSELKLRETIDPSEQKELAHWIKQKAGLDPDERTLPQDGRFNMPLIKEEFRVTTLPTVTGDSMVIRIIDPSEKQLKLAELGFRDEHAERFERIIQRPQGGLVLISGPSGSGKTTTLYATLQHLCAGGKRVVTVEDPVEHRIRDTSQVQVNERNGLTFAFALRSVLQQDPNIVMIGDIRDAETAELAVRAALSGRLVLGAIFGSHVLQTIQRLQSLGIDSDRLSSSLTCIVSQRLVRRVCHHCSQTVVATDEEMSHFDTYGLKDEELMSKGNFRSFFKAKMDGKVTVTRGAGCQQCNQTGAQGYVAIHEVLEVDKPLRHLLLQNTPMSDLKLHLEQNNFKPMIHDGLWKAREGVTVVEDIMNAVSDIRIST